MSKILIRSHQSLADKEQAGGADRLMINLATALAESGWEVHILCPDSGNHPNVSGVKYDLFNYPPPRDSIRKMINSIRGVKTFIEAIEKEKFDIILDDVSHIPFYPAHFFSDSDTVNAIFLHTAMFESALRFNGVMKGSIVALIDRTLPYLKEPQIICAGPSTERRIHQKLGYMNTHVLSPCVEIESFDFKFDPASKQVLYLGSLSKRKNVATLIRAWIGVEQEYPEAQLIIAGTGKQEEKLKKVTEKHGVNQIVFKGYVSEAEKKKLLRESLIFVIPSLMEGYVTTGIEALASGTIVIGSDTYGINDYIQNNDTGFLFDTDDVEGLRSRISQVLDNPEDMRRIATKGRELALAHSFSEFKQNADELFKQITYE